MRVHTVSDRNKKTIESFSPGRKLLSGIILLTRFVITYNFFDGTDGLDKLESHLEHNVFSFMGKDLSSVLGNIVVVLIGGLILYCAVSGSYRIFTFNKFIKKFEMSGSASVVGYGDNQYSNVEALIRYRESKMNGMSNNESAELLVRTAVLDSIASGRYSGTQTGLAASYLESKLSALPPDKALDFISGKK